MTPEELAPVWAALWADDPDAQEILVRQFLPLANYLARQALAKAPPHQSADDIHAYAHRGLLKAIAGFRPDGGAKFETYATRRITGAIIDGQRNDDPLSRGVRQRVKIVAAAVDELWDTAGREPSLAEISDLTSLEAEEVRQILVDQQSMNASLDSMAEEGHDQPLESEAEVLAQLAEVSDLVSQRLARMPGRERAFTLLYYRDGLSMADVQTELDIGSDWCGRTKQNVLALVRGR